MEHLHPRASSQPWKAIGLALVMAAPPVLASRASAQADAPQTTPATQAAQPDKPAVKTVTLQATKNGCVYQLENPNTDDERLVIVKDGKRNEFPTLKEADAQTAIYVKEVNKEVEQANASPISSWYSNGDWTKFHEKVPEVQYRWRLRAVAWLAETSEQMTREALLIQDSDSLSVYLQRYEIGQARRALNVKLTQAERLNGTIRLVYHAFADMKFVDQDRLRDLKDVRQSDLFDLKMRSLSLNEGANAHIVIAEGTPKFVANPEASGKKMLGNFHPAVIEEAIRYYKASERKGDNNLAAVLERAYKPPVKRPASPAPKR